MKLKYIFSLLILFFVHKSNAQIAEEVEMEIEDVPVVEVEEMASPFGGSGTGSGDGRGRYNNYQEQSLFDNYKLVYKTTGNSYQRVYGIKEDNRMILPVIFTYNYGNNKDNVILGLGQRFGIFNVETKKWDVPMTYSSIAALGKDMYKVSSTNGYGIVDKYNNTLVDFQWSDIRTIYGLENYLIVRDKSGPYKLAGVYNVIARKLVIPAQYKTIEKISTSDLFKVQNELNQFNIMDYRGNLKLKNWYDQLQPEKGGRPRYIVSKGNAWGIIDTDEKEIVKMNYRTIQMQPFTDGSYLAQNEKGKFGLMTIDGEVTLPFVYDNLEIQSYAGVGISSANSKCGVVKVNNGKPYELATCDYDNISLQNNVFIVEDKKKFGIMDVYGKVTVDIMYDEIVNLDGKNFKVKLKDKYSVIGSNGDRVTEKEYSDIQAISTSAYSGSYYNYNQRFSYYKTKTGNGKYGVLDKAGLEILDGTFDDILGENSNLLTVKMGDKMGVYNLYKRSYDIPAEYDQLVQNGSLYYGFKGDDIYTITLGSRPQVTKIAK